MSYLILLGVVFGVNLLPAFGPPTWAVLVFFRLQSNLDPVALVVLGALAAGSGRLILAAASRHLRNRLSGERIASLEAVRERLARGRKRALAGLGLFALSPLPSAQLFIAAGVVAVPLLPLTFAFFAGRLVSYSLYVTAASAAKHSFGGLITGSFTSPAGVALQVLMLAGLVALLRVDWAARLSRHGGRTKPPSPEGSKRPPPAAGSAREETDHGIRALVAAAR